MNVFLRIHRNPNPDKINTPYVSNLIFAFFLLLYCVRSFFLNVLQVCFVCLFFFLNTACKYKPKKSLHHMCQTCFCCWLAVFWCLVTSTRCFALRFICMNVFLRIHRNPNRYKINTPYVSNLIFALFLLLHCARLFLPKVFLGLLYSLFL